MSIVRKESGDSDLDAVYDKDGVRIFINRKYRKRNRHADISMLCDCEILASAIRKGALSVTPSGSVVIGKPSFNGRANGFVEERHPIAHCIGCGKSVGPAVENNALRTGPVVGCCHEMQKAICDGILRLPAKSMMRKAGRSAILRGEIESPFSDEIFPHDHCPWCGKWYQLLLIRHRILQNR